MQSTFSYRFLFILWRRHLPHSRISISSPSSPPKHLFSASSDDLEGLMDSNSKSVSMADFSFLKNTPPPAHITEVRPQADDFTGDAVSICDFIAESGDNFGEKTQRFLSKYRAKLDGSLVASVLRMMGDLRMAVKFFIWAGRQIGYTHTAAVYDVMVKILNPGGRDSLFDRFVDEIEAEGGKEVVGELLNTMVRKWCFGGEWEMALEELGKLKERGLKPFRTTYYALIRVFLNADMARSAEELRKEMAYAGFALDGPTMAAFVYSLSRKDGGWREALGLMEEERFTADTVIYTRMIDGLCESSRFEDALLLLDVMRTRSCLPNTATYTIFLSACLREKKTVWCKRVLRMMITQGCYPGHSLFNAVLHLFCTFSYYISAYKLLRKMEALHHPPQATAYNIFIGNICGEEEDENPLSAGELELAEKAYERLLHGGMALNKVNVCRFSRRLTEAGKFEKAAKLIHEMMDRGFVPDGTTYAKVIHLLSNSSNMEKAFCLFEEMKRSGFTPDVFLYSVLIDLLGKAGLVRRAGTLFSEMVASGCAPTVVTFTSLIHARLKAGMVAEARELFDTMLSHGCAPNTITYTALIDGYCKAGELGRACEVFDKMSTAPNGCVPDVLTYGAMVDGLCRSGRTEEAEGLVEGMGRGCDPNEHVYHSLINRFCKEGRVDRAQRVVEKMVESQHGPNVYVYASLIDTVFKRGRMDLALPVLARMMEESCPPNVVVFTEMVDGLCKAGRVEEAGRMMDLMAAKGCPPNVVTYTAMIDGLCRAGKVERGLELLEEMEGKGCAANMVTYRVLINHCCEAGMVERADALLTEMRQTCWPKHVWEYRKVIEGFGREFAASLGVLQEDMVSLVPVSRAVIDRLCVSGRLDRALQLKEEVCSTNCCYSHQERGIYSALLEGVSAAGRVEKAFELYVEMESRGGDPDSVMFWQLVKALLVVNRWGDALQLCHGLCSFSSNTSQ